MIVVHSAIAVRVFCFVLFCVCVWLFVLDVVCCFCLCDFDYAALHRGLQK
jgi:hypothetical protein